MNIREYGSAICFGKASRALNIIGGVVNRGGENMDIIINSNCPPRPLAGKPFTSFRRASVCGPIFWVMSFWTVIASRRVMAAVAVSAKRKTFMMVDIVNDSNSMKKL